MSFKYAIDAYRQLTASNERALQMLHALAQRGDAETREELSGSIKQMTQCVSRIFSNVDQSTCEKEELLYQLMNRCSAIVQNAADFAQFTIDKPQHSPRFATRLAAARNSHVYALGKEFTGEAATKRKPKDIKTPHELIRYLHQMANDALFTPTDNAWNGVDGFTQRPGAGIEGRILAFEDGLQHTFDSDPYISVLGGTTGLQFPSAKRTVVVYALHGGAESIMQFHMGCHFASLKVSRGTQRHAIEMRYTDTNSYDSSTFRQEFVATILPRLGYTVKRTNGYQFRGTHQGDRENVTTAYRNLLRLVVSLRDVDCISSLGSPSSYKPAKNGKTTRLEDAVAAFRVGVVNMHNYLCNAPMGGYEEFAKEEGTLLPAPLFPQ